MQRSKKILAIILALVLCISLLSTLALAAPPVVSGKVVVGGDNYRILSTGGTQTATIALNSSIDTATWQSFVSGKMYMTATNGMVIDSVLYTNLATGSAMYTADRNILTIDDDTAMHPTNIYLSNITQSSAINFERAATHIFSVLPKGASSIADNIEIDADKTELRTINIIIQQAVTVNITNPVSGGSLKVNTTAYDTGKNTYNSTGSATTLSNGSIFYVDTGTGYQSSPRINVTAPADYAALYNGVQYANGTIITLDPITAATAIEISFVKTTPDVYHLLYNANGGSNAPDDSNDYSGTTTVNLLGKSGIGTMAKTGQAFVGWTTVAHNDLSATDTPPTTITQMYMNNDDRTVYALWGIDTNGNGVWDGLDIFKYSLSYDANGGTGAPTDSNEYVGTATVNLVSKSGIGSMAKAGYAFVGWSTTAQADLSATGTAPAMVTQITMNNANRTVYAVWGIDADNDDIWDGQATQYTLSFNLNYAGAPAIASQSLKAGQAPAGVSNPSRAGYTFAGWKNAATGASVNLSSFAMPANDVVLIAEWTANSGTDTIRPFDPSDPGNKNPDDADEWLVPGGNGSDDNGGADDIIVDPNEDSNGKDNSYINDDGDLVLPDGGQGTDSGGHTTEYIPGTVIKPDGKINHIARVRHIEVDLDGNPTGKVLKETEEVIFDGNTFTAEVGLFRDANDVLYAYVGADPSQSITLSGRETSIPNITLMYTEQSDNMRVVIITVKLQGLSQDVPGYPNGIREFPVKENTTVIFNAPAVRDYNADPTMQTVEATSDKTIIFNYTRMEDAPPELIKEDHFAYMLGDDLGKFNPDANMTRAEAAMMFFRLLKDKNPSKAVSFTDVASNAWYTEAVLVLASKHIIQGYPDGTFGPDKPITRAEFITMVSRFNDLTGGENPFSDIASEHWAYRYIISSAMKRLVEGYPDGTVRPEKNITRAEATKIVNALLGRVADKSYIDLNFSSLKRFPDVDKLHWAYYEIVEATNGHNYNKNPNEIWTGLKP